MRLVVLRSALILLLVPVVSRAHLIPAQQGTVNVVDHSAFLVLSVPVSALTGVDDDRDGVLSLQELQSHLQQLRGQIDSRFVVTDGERSGKTVRIDLGLSPEHEAATDRAAHLLVLKHTRFESTPSDLRVRCDLFGAEPAEKQLNIVATRAGIQGRESETASLTPGHVSHAFFRSAHPAWAARLGAGLVVLLLSVGVALLVWRALPVIQAQQTVMSRGPR